MYLTITLCAQLEPDIASKRYHAVWARTFFFTCWSALTLTFNPERLMQCYFKLFNQTHSMDETWARLGGVKLFFRQNVKRTNWKSSVTINFLFVLCQNGIVRVLLVYISRTRSISLYKPTCYFFRYFNSCVSYFLSVYHIVMYQ